MNTCEFCRKGDHDRDGLGELGPVIHGMHARCRDTYAERAITTAQRIEGHHVDLTAGEVSLDGDLVGFVEDRGDGWFTTLFAVEGGRSSAGHYRTAMEAAEGVASNVLAYAEQVQA